MHYSMVKPHSSNFRVITTNILGVRIFRKFTVLPAAFALPSNGAHRNHHVIHEAFAGLGTSLI